MYPFNKNDDIAETIFSSFKRAYLNVFGDIGMEAIEEKIIEGMILSRFTGQIPIWEGFSSNVRLPMLTRNMKSIERPSTPYK